MTVSGHANAGGGALVKNGAIRHKRTNHAFISGLSSSGACVMSVIDVLLDATGSSTANTSGAVQFGSFSSGYLNCSGLRVAGFVTGSALVSSGLSAFAYGSRVVFDDCELPDVTVTGPTLAGVSYANYGMAGIGAHGVSYVSRRAKRDFFWDSFNGYVGWNSTRGQPTRNAILDDAAASKYSIIAVPATIAGNLPAFFPLLLPRLEKINSNGSTAQRTIKVSFVAQKDLVLTNGVVSLLVMYDTASGMKVLDTFDVAGAASISAGVGSQWSTWNGSYVTYQNSGTVNHNAYQIEVTTPAGSDMLAGSTVVVIPRIHASVGNLTQSYFFDPDFDIT
jgi:hypothetical protein